MRHAYNRGRRWAFPLAVVLLALTSACGSGGTAPGEASSSSPTGPGRAAPGPEDAAPGGARAPSSTAPAPAAEREPVLPATVLDGTGREVTVTSVERILPVDGDLAEVVFALGLGDRVVATDLSATYPPEADALPEIGYQRALVAEPILAFSPTVVLATDIARPVEVLDQLRPHVPVVTIVAPDSLEGPARKIRDVAAALGVPGRGEALARATEASIAEALAAVPERARQQPLRAAALYLRGERTQQLFGPGSGMHVLLEAVGLVDVGEVLGVDDIQPISTEALVAEPPDVLVVTTTGLESVGGIDGLLAMPAFSRSPAAAGRRVLAYEDLYLLGFGPRTGELLTELVHDLYAPN